MSFAMASLIADGPITVLDCANVDTSFPGFADVAGKAGLAIERVVGDGTKGGGADEAADSAGARP